MSKYRIPEEVIILVKAMYNKCTILDEGEKTEWFQVQSGIRLCHVLLPISTCN